MASIRSLPTGKFELTLRNKILLGSRRIYFTFDNEQQARDYGRLVEGHFKAGRVPDDLLQASAPAGTNLRAILRDWIKTGKPAPTDVPVLGLLMDEVGSLLFAELRYAWCEQWAQDMKLQQNFAPGTIRKRIGSLSRCIDWYLRSNPESLASNPLKLLPRGTSTYTQLDARQAIAAQKLVKVDVERDRRLAPGEEDAIRAALAGDKRADRERALAIDPAMTMLYELIVDTGLRLREAYTLTVGQVDIEQHTLRVKSSKQRHGKIKFRSVPLKRPTQEKLVVYLASRPWLPDDLLFPYWNGTEAGLNAAGSRWSGKFGRLFQYAGCDGLTEHDLRHEATCRWFELRRPDGNWVFRDAEIHKIMGWAPGSRMGARYASFRADDLASRLW